MNWFMVLLSCLKSSTKSNITSLGWKLLKWRRVYRAWNFSYLLKHKIAVNLQILIVFTLLWSCRDRHLQYLFARAHRQRISCDQSNSRAITYKIDRFWVENDFWRIEFLIPGYLLKFKSELSLST